MRQQEIDLLAFYRKGLGKRQRGALAFFAEYPDWHYVHDDSATREVMNSLVKRGVFIERQVYHEKQYKFNNVPPFFSFLDSTGYILHYPLPKACIADCSSQGAVDSSVKFWLAYTGFNAPESATREYLKSMGAWEDSELLCHETNLQRLLWAVCCDLNEGSKQ